MRHLLLPLLLLPVLAGAQSVPAEPVVGLPAPARTQADTLRALHNLFEGRRSTGGWLSWGSATVTAITGVGTLVDNNGRNCGGYFCPDAVGSALLLGIGTAPAWIPGGLILIRFSRKREQQAVADYERTRKLPERLQKRLTGRFFNSNYHFSKPN